MMAVIAIANHAHGTVAHALDFDLVSVASSEDEAVAKLRLAVKSHVEFGIKMGIERDIMFPAPKKFWESLTPNSSLSIGEPIEIDHHWIATAYRTTSDETELSLSAA
jgi:hypothetical protein